MKNIKKILLTFVFALLLVTPFVKALENDDIDLISLDDETVPVVDVTNVDDSKIVNKTDNFKAGDDLTITGNYNRSTFFAGSSIYDNANVNGIGFVAGDSINILGKHEYGFVAGNKIDIKGEYEKDLFVAGNVININKTSKIGRDFYLAGNKATISTVINGNLYVAASTLNLDNTVINGNVYVTTSNLVLGDNVVINGTLKYNDNANTKGIDASTITKVETYKGIEREEETTKVKIQDFVVSLLGLLLIGVILNALWPNIFKKLKEVTNEYNFVNGLKDTLIGFLILIALPVFLIIMLMTIIGVPLAIIGFIMYGIMIYLTNVFVGYLLGDVLIRKVFNKTDVNNYLAILLGIVIIELLKVVPFVGALVSIITLCLGLGIIKKILISKKEVK